MVDLGNVFRQIRQGFRAGVVLLQAPGFGRKNEACKDVWDVGHSLGNQTRFFNAFPIAFKPLSSKRLGCSAVWESLISHRKTWSP